MAQARLAAMRAQQQQQRGDAGGRNYDDDSNTQNSYPPQQAAASPYQPRRANPYAQQDVRPQNSEPAYQMSEVQSSSANLLSSQYPPAGAASGGAGDMTAFYAEIGSIQDTLREFNDNVARIGDLHSRSLNNTDDAAAQRVQADLEQMVDDTSALSGDLKRRIQTLARKGAPGRDGQIRKQQTQLVKEKFKEAIQNYQQVEQQFRQRYKQRMERQFKIVKPDATPEEVKAVVEDTQGGQMFQQALMSSNRYGESKTAYREVQERHEEIKKIEQTLTELAQLFNDMSVLVEQQDEMITQIEATTAEAEKDLEVGVQYTEKAVASAAGARKKRWICFVIIIVIVIILAIIIVVKVVLPAVNKPADKKETVTVTGSATATGAVASPTTALAALVTGVANTFVERAVLVMPTQTAISPF